MKITFQTSDTDNCLTSYGARITLNYFIKCLQSAANAASILEVDYAE